MNAKLQDIIAYLLRNYPQDKKDDFSNARVTKMVYLADWHQAINFNRQITDIDWYFDNYGPFVWDVDETVKAHPKLFKREEPLLVYGPRKIMFKLRDRNYAGGLTREQRQSLDHVIKSTSKMKWDDFITLVYSTHPILTSERYTHLDLVAKAKDYEKSKQPLVDDDED